MFFSSFILVATKHLPDVDVRFGTLHSPFKLYLLPFSLSSLSSRIRYYSIMDFSPTAPNSPNTLLYDLFKLWLFLPRFICPYLSPRNCSVMDFFPTAQSCFLTVQTHRCHRWSKHPCSHSPIHIPFMPLNVRNASFPVVLLLFLILAYFSPSSSPLPLHLIQPQYFLRVCTT